MSFVMTRVLKKNKQTVEEVVAVFWCFGDFLCLIQGWVMWAAVWAGMPMDLMWRPAILHKLRRGRASEPALWPIVNTELWRANPSSVPPIKYIYKPATAGLSLQGRSGSICLRAARVAKSAAEGWSNTEQTSPETRRCTVPDGRYHSWTDGSWRYWSGGIRVQCSVHVSWKTPLYSLKLKESKTPTKKLSVRPGAGRNSSNCVYLRDWGGRWGKVLLL